MVEPFSNADLSEIVVKLEGRLHETRMALYGTLKALSILIQETPLSEEAYARIKVAILEATSEMRSKDDDES